MHPGQVITLAVILNGQLPVGFNIQLKRCGLSPVVKWAVKFGPARHKIFVDLFKRRGISIDIHENNIAPHE